MRTPKYLSPTSFGLWYKDPEEFYLRYLADERPPPFPQTQPMSVGSAFDAFVKSYLYEKLFGIIDPAFELQTIFENQVEEQNRDFAYAAGKYCFDQYKEHGALADLMSELELAETAPRFEFHVEGTVHYEGNIAGVPFHGYPDVYYHTRDGAAVILDWKVNGFCSKSNTSPAKGYIMLRGPEGMRGVGGMHKDAQTLVDNGMIRNIAIHMEQVDSKWADQESIYGWILGEEIGSQFIVGIDQLACGPNDGSNQPPIRIARHRCTVSADYQKKLYEKAVWVWSVIQSGHIFRDMSKEDSLTRQSMLDQMHAAYSGVSKNDKWFTNKTRQHSNF